MGSFRLDADVDGDGTFEAMVVQRSLTVPYSGVAGNALTGRDLDLTVNFASVTANGSSPPRFTVGVLR